MPWYNLFNYSMGIRGGGGGSQDIPEFWDTGPQLEREQTSQNFGAPVLQMAIAVYLPSNGEGVGP